MAFVVKAGETLLDILDEFGKGGPALAEGGNGLGAELPTFGKPFFKACLHVLVGKMIFGVHADHKMEVIGHDAESEDIRKIEPAQIFDEIEEVVLLGVAKGEAIKGGSGNDVVDGGDVSTDEPCDAWHEGTSENGL